MTDNFGADPNKDYSWKGVTEEAGHMLAIKVLNDHIKDLNTYGNINDPMLRVYDDLYGKIPGFDQTIRDGIRHINENFYT